MPNGDHLADSPELSLTTDNHFVSSQLAGQIFKLSSELDSSHISANIEGAHGSNLLQLRQILRILSLTVHRYHKRRETVHDWFAIRNKKIFLMKCQLLKKTVLRVVEIMGLTMLIGFWPHRQQYSCTHRGISLTLTRTPGPIHVSSTTLRAPTETSRSLTSCKKVTTNWQRGEPSHFN